MPVRSDPRLRALERPSRRGKPRRRPLALVALGSDGGFFDSMAENHESCYLAAFAAVFGEGFPLPLLRELWREAGLASRFSAESRFRALAATLRFFGRRYEALPNRSLWLRSAEALEAWLSLEPAPSGSRLEATVAGISFGRVRRGGGGALGRGLQPILRWLREAEALIEALPSPRPFPGALAALSLMGGQAELFVLAAAPEARLRSDWSRARLKGRVAAFLGEEEGEARSSLPAYAAAALAEGRIAEEKLLVVSASASALEAARASGGAFFPIIRGREEECWSLLTGGGFERFFAGSPASSPQLLAEFLASFRRLPTWRSRCS